MLKNWSIPWKWRWEPNPQKIKENPKQNHSCFHPNLPKQKYNKVTIINQVNKKLETKNSVEGDSSKMDNTNKLNKKIGSQDFAKKTGGNKTEEEKNNQYKVKEIRKEWWADQE